MRILNLQISKTRAIRIVENHEGGIDFVEFIPDSHYVESKPGTSEALLVTIPIDRRNIIADFVRLHVMIEDKPSPKPERT